MNSKGGEIRGESKESGRCFLKAGVLILCRIQPFYGLTKVLYSPRKCYAKNNVIVRPKAISLVLPLIHL